MNSFQNNSLIRVDIVSSKGKQINTFKFFKDIDFFPSHPRCKCFDWAIHRHNFANTRTLFIALVHLYRNQFFAD